MDQKKKIYDLEKRTEAFGKSIIDLCRAIKTNNITRPLVDQLVRSSTSIGANYMEANGASSKKDFKNKIHICKKESQETKYWLRMINHAEPSITEKSGRLWQGAQELTMIFQKIITSLQN